MVPIQRYRQFFSNRAIRRFINWNNDSVFFVFLGIIRIYFDVYKKRGPATASPQDERDISVDLVNNEANHFALYL